MKLTFHLLLMGLYMECKSLIHSKVRCDLHDIYDKWPKFFTKVQLNKRQHHFPESHYFLKPLMRVRFYDLDYVRWQERGDFDAI